jgi:hypothetical protein
VPACFFIASVAAACALCFAISTCLRIISSALSIGCMSSALCSSAFYSISGCSFLLLSAGTVSCLRVFRVESANTCSLSSILALRRVGLPGMFVSSVFAVSV